MLSTETASPATRSGKARKQQPVADVLAPGSLAFYSRGQVLALTSLKKSTLANMIREGLFPAPVQLTRRRVGWAVHQVQGWIKAKMEASNVRAP